MTTADRNQSNGRTSGGPARRRPTGADVAREAGVSRATVSYVLSGRPKHRIPPSTADRVKAAALRLGYTPSATARALKLGRTDVVVGLLPDWPIGHTTGRVLELLATEFEAAGLTFMAHLGTHSGPAWAPGTWRGVSPVGIVSIEPMSPANVAAILADGVVVEQWFTEKDVTDGGPAGRSFRGVGRAQVEYLASIGHTRLGYAYPADPRVRPFADARLEGAREACLRLGLGAPTTETVGLDLVAASRAVSHWTNHKPAVTAVCAYNDEVAMAILAAAEALNVGVPERLAVIGVEDIPTAPFAHPPLTSIALDNRPHARFVVASLAAKLRGDDPPTPPAGADHRIVVRAST